jgi:outer membrane receptor protein involved in Fe transport
MKKLITLLFTIFFGTLSLFAQFGNDYTPGETIIWGLVKDQATNAPMEYANISIYRSKDSVLINGSITGANGYFLIKGLPKDTALYAEIEFIGFTAKKTDSFTLTSELFYHDMGEIILSASVNVLNEVEVAEEVRHVEYKIDKKIINPTKDIVSEGGSAVDVLENTPSIQVDLDGNVSLRGSGNFKLLIDGKPSVLQGSEGLRQIPSGSIDRIEVITNPSARYDASGTAGIINVILKKEKKDGINGMLTSSYGRYNQYSLYGLLNIRKGKFNFFVGGSTSRYPSPSRSESFNRTYSGDSVFYLNSFTKDGSNSEWRSSNYNVKGGFDYSLTEKDIFTLSGNFGNWKYGGDFITLNNEFLIDSNNPNTHFDERFYLQNNNWDIQGTYYSGSLDYLHKFADMDHEITAHINYNGNVRKDTSVYNLNYTDNSYEILNNIPDSLASSQTISNGSDYDFEGKIDYIRPLFKSGKLESGYKYSTTQGDSKYYYMVFDPYSNQYINIANLENPMRLNLQIHAAYLMFSHEIWGLGYQLGLRMENTSRTFTKLLDQSKYEVNYTEFFPSIHVSKKIGEMHQIMASYSRRIQRPQPWFLDPQVTVTGPHSLRQGNPELKPEFIDSYELGYSLIAGMNYVSLEAFYRQTNNMISHVTYNTDTSATTVISTFENLNKDYSYGLELMGNFNITKWFMFNTGGSIYNYYIEGDINDTEINDHALTYRMWLNPTFKIPKTDTRIQFNSYYGGPSIRAFSKTDPYYSVGVGIKQEFFKKKLSVSIGADNIIHAETWHSVTDSGNFYSDSYYYIPGWKYRVSLTYRLNDFKQRKDDNTSKGAPQGGQGGMM